VIARKLRNASLVESGYGLMESSWELKDGVWFVDSDVCRSDPESDAKEQRLYRQAVNS